jgi:hypothetical protein
MTPTTASWHDRLRHALVSHALIEAGDLARGTTSSSAALLAVRAVQDAIAQAEADGATEAEMDEIIAGRAPTAAG